MKKTAKLEQKCPFDRVDVRVWGDGAGEMHSPVAGRVRMQEVKVKEKN